MTQEERQKQIDNKIRVAHEMIDVAKMNIQYEFYNSAVNRLYYACFHIAGAFLLKCGVDSIKSHDGVKTLFSLYAVKTGVVERRWSAFYASIMQYRSEADYDEFKIYTKGEAESLLPLTEEFVSQIDILLKQ